MVEIKLHINGETTRNGLKSIQTHFNLFPDSIGRIEVNGIDCGEANSHNAGMVINDGLSRRLSCRRCDGEKWICRGDKAPKFCPHCKSPYWHKFKRV